MNKKLVFFLCLFSLFSFTSCSEKQESVKMDTTVQVQTASVEKGDLSVESTYIGTISAEGTANVVSLVSGNVEEVYVSMGDIVAKGDKLCQLDDRSARLNLNSAQAGYSMAQAGYSNAQAGYSNAQAGYSNAQAGYSNAQAGYSMAQAGRSSAQAGYSMAQAGRSSAQAGYSMAQAGHSSAQAGHSSAEQAYNSTVATYGGEEMSLLQEQVRMAQENYNATVALFEIGAASRLEVDQAKQALDSAVATLEAAKKSVDATKSNVEATSAGIQSAEASIESAEAGIQSAEASIESAEAGIQSAEASMKSAEAGIQSAEASMKSAEAGIQSAEAGIESAKANIQSAEAGIASAEYQLSLYQLSSPISGVVESVNVMANNFATSGMVAFVISNAENKTVTFYVTDEVMKKMTIGQAVTVSSQNGNHSGTVTEISGIVDSHTGMFKVKALVDNARDLPDGLSVSVTTVSNVSSNAVIVSSDCLYFDNGVAYVYTAKEGKAVRTDVEVSLYTKEKTAISAGISDEDIIITSWSSGLKNGAKIEIKAEKNDDSETDEVTTE